jgi:hypothetical protein
VEGLFPGRWPAAPCGLKDVLFPTNIKFSFLTSVLFNNCSELWDQNFTLLH